MERKDLMMLLWSDSQGCFHLEEAEEALHKNRRAYFQGWQNDYVTLGIFESREDALEARATLHQMKCESAKMLQAHMAKIEPRHGRGYLKLVHPANSD